MSSSNLLQTLSFQQVLGTKNFADSLDHTLENSLASTSFRVFLITVQKLDLQFADNIIIIRKVVYCIINILNRNSTRDEEHNPNSSNKSSKLNLQSSFTYLKNKNTLIKSIIHQLKLFKSPSFTQILKLLDDFWKFYSNNYAAILSFELERTSSSSSDKSNSSNNSNIKLQNTSTASKIGSFFNITKNNTESTTPQILLQLLTNIDTFLNNHFQIYKKSDHYSKYQFKFFNQKISQISLADIFAHESASMAFSEFLELEQAGSILEFLYSISAFQASFNILSKENLPDSKMRLKEDAMNIYSKFISPTSPSKIGFGEKVRKEIESNICVKFDENVKNGSFEAAEKQALMTLNSVYFKAFRGSASYSTFLQGLLLSCRLIKDKTPDLRKRRQSRPRIYSSDSDEQNYNEQIEKQKDDNIRDSFYQNFYNTVDSVFREITTATFVYYFENFSNEFDYYTEVVNNPDILWYRPNMSKHETSIGYVDSLGKFNINKDLINRPYVIPSHLADLNINLNLESDRKNIINLINQNITQNFINSNPHQGNPEHLKVESVEEYNKRSSYYDYLGIGKVYKKFAGNTTAEEIEMASSVAREFLNNLLISQPESL